MLIVRIVKSNNFFAQFEQIWRRCAIGFDKGGFARYPWRLQPSATSSRQPRQGGNTPAGRLAGSPSAMACAFDRAKVA